METAGRSRSDRTVPTSAALRGRLRVAVLVVAASACTSPPAKAPRGGEPPAELRPTAVEDATGRQASLEEILHELSSMLDVDRLGARVYPGPYEGIPERVRRESTEEWLAELLEELLAEEGVSPAAVGLDVEERGRRNE